MGTEKRNNSSAGASGQPRTSAHLQRIQARNKRIALLAVSACVCLAVIVGIIVGLVLLLQEPADDGLILPNVTVGGVNIGGMTPDEATSALRVSVYDRIRNQSLSVELPGATLVLAPTDTKASLDLDALVADAYAYGRSGSRAENNLTRARAENTTHTIALLSYLSLDLEYIRSAVDTFCDGYSIRITQPTVSIQGTRPVYVAPVEEEPEDPENPEEPTEPAVPAEPVPVVHQVMTIVTGTPQFVLDSDDLYDAVLDAYSLFQMTVSYEAPNRVEPEQVDLAAVFEKYCTEPVDAALDSKTYTVTPEVVGYGFDISAVQALLDEAGYGQEIKVTLCFLMPDITAKAYSNFFKDILASYTSQSGDLANTNRNTNLQLSCEAINGYVIKAGESFDLNQVLGPRTTDRGYKTAPTYTGSTTSSVGGGVDQTASTLRYCALLAGLQIDESHTHRYAVPYTPLGTDATVAYGGENLVFTNNTEYPIRILAETTGDLVTIQLLGTGITDRQPQIEMEVLETFQPGTIYQSMGQDNVYGYVDGQVLVSSLTGYTVRIYLCQYDPETGDLLSRTSLGVYSYEMRNQTVVRIERADSGTADGDESASDLSE